MQLLQPQMLIASYLLSNSRIGQVVHTRTHAPALYRHMHNSFHSNEFLSLHEQRQNALRVRFCLYFIPTCQYGRNV